MAVVGFVSHWWAAARSRPQLRSRCTPLRRSYVLGPTFAPSQALDAILEADTSIAVFAPGWTWEVAGDRGRNNASEKNDQLWWAGPSTN